MGLNYKRTVFVGGLSLNVTEESLERAFVPFGPIKKVEIPVESIPTPEYSKRSKLTRNRGFAYIEYIDEDDAEAAANNMHLSELEDRILRVQIAPKETFKLATGVPELHKVNEWYLSQLEIDGLRSHDEANEYDKSVLR